MWNAVEGEPQAVVFVSDRAGAALRRRERCLKLAGIVHELRTERRPSGTYYKLCVRESDTVAAHLALQMGGCNRSLKLKESRPSVLATVREMSRTAWDEAVLLFWRLGFRARCRAAALDRPVRRFRRVTRPQSVPLP